MEEKDIIIIKKSQDNRITLSSKGLEIRRKGKPVKFESSGIGFVYLLIDCSSSMAEGNKLTQAKKGAIEFAKKAIAQGYFVGLIRFDSYADCLCEPTREISLLKQKVEMLDPGGFTFMAKAISLAHKTLKNVRGERIIVVATDGEPNGPGDPETSLAAGEAAKRDRIEIIAIGTDDADWNFLRKLASRKDLGIKVPQQKFGETIALAAKNLPQLESKKKGGG